MIELVTAMVASVILLAGLGSVMLIARQIAYTPSASTHRLEASRVIGEMTDELRLATYLTEHTPILLAFVIADRNGDGVEERIRYEWSGTPGDPLLRTYNSEDPVAVLDSVQDFNLGYLVEDSITSIETTVDSAPVVLQENMSIQVGTPHAVSSSNWFAQQIDPSLFLLSAPANALHWNATGVEFHAAIGGAPTGILSVELRSTGAPSDGPTSHVLSKVEIPESSLTGAFQVTFPTPIRELPLHRKFALAWTTTSADVAAVLRSDAQASSGVVETSDGGASWKVNPTKKPVYFRLRGTYTTPGPTHDVTRNHLTHVSVLLQTGAQAHSRVEASISLTNRPEVLSAYWRTDFDVDPTSSDSNGDGTPDWQAAPADEVAGSVAYDSESISNGTWLVTGKLRTQPLHDFIMPTIVEVRFRDTSVGGSGAVVTINADWQDGLHAPLSAGVQLQADGTQSLWLKGKTNNVTEVTLLRIRKLSGDFIRCRLTILPEHDVVNVHINDEDVGTYSYPTYTPSSTDRFVAVYGDSNTAEFDYVEVKVSESD